jgi:hypothetical protein
MRQDATRRLYGYWQRLRAGRIAPEREEIEPADISGLLRDMFILGRDPTAVESHAWRFRLAGTRVSALAGQELKGRLYADLWDREGASDGERLAAGVANDAFPVVAGVSGLLESGEGADLELLLLPLRHEGRLGVRVMGGLFPTRHLAARPTARVDTLRLVSARTLLPVPEGERDLPGIRAPVPDHLPPPERRAAFRLIEGGLAR